MSRPATTVDVTERFVEIGRIEVGALGLQPALLKSLATFQESLVKSGGELRQNYSQIMFHLPRTEEQLKDQLRSDQYHWDEMEKIYDACTANGTEPESWRKASLEEWIAREGVSTPWAVEKVDA